MSRDSGILFTGVTTSIGLTNYNSSGAWQVMFGFRNGTGMTLDYCAKYILGTHCSMYLNKEKNIGMH